MHTHLVLLNQLCAATALRRPPWAQVWNVQSAGARGAIVVNFEVRSWRCGRVLLGV